MSFAALQARVNAAVAAKLITDAALLNGSEVTGQFVSPAAAAFNMLDGNEPSFTCLYSAISGDPRGKLLEIDGEGYAVRRAIDDGSGMTRLILEQLNAELYAAAKLKTYPIQM